MKSYQVVQFTEFRQADTVSNDSLTADVEPLDTRLLMEADISPDVAARSLKMSERTCFLHAAMRGELSYEDFWGTQWTIAGGEKRIDSE